MGAQAVREEFRGWGCLMTHDIASTVKNTISMLGSKL